MTFPVSQLVVLSILLKGPCFIIQELAPVNLKTYSAKVDINVEKKDRQIPVNPRIVLLSLQFDFILSPLSSDLAYCGQAKCFEGRG